MAGKRNFQSYTIKGTTYNAEDCVLLQAPEADVERKGFLEPYYIARIKHFTKNKDKVMVNVNWFYWPEETKDGRQKFHGAKEVLESTECEYQDVSTIVMKCTIIRMKVYCGLEFNDMDTVQYDCDTTYFCRFRYVDGVVELVGGGTLERIPVFCICDRPTNPDKLMVYCYICKNWFHFSCINKKDEENAEDDYFCITCLKKQRLELQSDTWRKYHRSKAKRRLTRAEIKEVSEAFDRPISDVIVPYARIKSINADLSVKLYHCLKPPQWLNEEVINIYFELLMERQRRKPLYFLKCLFLSSFFWTKLLKDGNEGVRRWNKEHNFLDFDKIFVPIHYPNHWCLVVIDQLDQTFIFLDSLKGFGDGASVLNRLADFYKYHMEQRGRNIDMSTWNLAPNWDFTPLQTNTYDCGMFMLKYADYLSRGLDLCFTEVTSR